MRFLLLMLASALIAAGPAWAQAPSRIVSLNVCADQWLIALADPMQIAGLSPFSRDPMVSAAASEAHRFPRLRGAAEEVLLARADLVIAAPGRSRETVQALRAHGVPVLLLSRPQNFSEIAAEARRVAAALGHADRGEAMVAMMEARLSRLPARPQSEFVVAHYQRRGYLSGTGTLMDDLIARAGFVNLASRLGRPALSQLSLEELALARPDALIVETAAIGADRGSEILTHPILDGIARIDVPQAWTVCGGPAYVDAAERLSASARMLR